MIQQTGPFACISAVTYDVEGRMVRSLTCSCGESQDVKGGPQWKSEQEFGELAKGLLETWFAAHARGESFELPRCRELGGV